MNLQRTQILSGPTGNINGTMRSKAPFSWRQCLFTNELASETLPGQRTPDSGAEKV